MTWLNAVWSEFLGLFVDDGSFAGAILGWLAVAWFGLRHLRLPSSLPPAILFAGLVVILLESATRRARGSRAP